jgi:hypothetical protein
MREYKHMVVGVFPTEDHPGTPFAYTAGRGTELLMAGPIPIEVMGQLLNDLADLEDVEGLTLEAGQRIPGILAGELHLALVEVRDMREAEMFQSTGTRALQAVWPDKDDRFPWDEGYLHGELQPVFGDVV